MHAAAARYVSPRTPEALLAALKPSVEPLGGGFTFVSKLSGGGIVVRVLRAPESERRWFGVVEADGFRVALAPKEGAGGPYQPILRGAVRAAGEGCVVELTLAPHPDARMFSVVFTLGGALLAAASLVALPSNPSYGALGLLMAAGFLAFPGLRAEISFRAACEEALAALEGQLQLEPAPDA